MTRAQLPQRHRLSILVLTSLAASQLLPAATPDPPPQICVNNKCSAMAGSSSSKTGAIKWHPGHYVLSDNRPDSPKFQSANQAVMKQMAQVNDSSGKPGFAGYIGDYSWYWLEPSPGNYNTSLIDSDLAYLAQLSKTYGRTFRLIIQVLLDSPADKPTSCPSVPQPTPYSSASANYSPAIVPDYIISGVSGLGSDCFSNPNNQGITAAFWRPAVMARYAALLNYLGSKYDSNPNVEMIIPFQQTTDSPNNPPSDDTAQAEITAYENLADAMRGSWPTTVKIFNVNFTSPEMSQVQLLGLTQHVIADGFGLGGPDTAQPSDGVCGGTCSIGKGDGPTFGMGIMMGAGNPNYGTVNFSGQVPTGWQEQADAYIHPSETASGIEAFQYGSLHATHEIWGNHGTNGTPAQQWSSGVVATLQAQNFRIHSECPTLFLSGCNTN